MGMTIFHLLPEVYHEALHTHEEHSDFGDKAIGVWIVVGILLQIVLEFFSHGAEHGHFHSPAKGLQTHFPWGLFISLSIHSLLEGFPLHEHSNMVYGIFIHLGTRIVGQGANYWGILGIVAVLATGLLLMLRVGNPVAEQESAA